jgi:biotin transport system substrate-specific component
VPFAFRYNFASMNAHVTTGSLFSHSIPRSSAPVRAIAVALGVAVTAAAAQVSVPLPFTAVPFTFQPMAVLLVSAVLGSRLGFLTQALYLAAGAAGLAVFAPSVTLPPGALRLAGPTAGYLWAYPVAAFLTGWLAERGWDRRYLTSAAAMIAGLLVIFAGGVSWLAVAFAPSFGAALSQGFLAFIGPDLVKVAVAALILPQAWRMTGLSGGDQRRPNTRKY